MKVDALKQQPAESITPFVNILGNTVRVVFPFEQDTPAAVFRRGDSVWMLFDTVSGINPPPTSSELGAIAKSFDVVSSGATQVVRIDLSKDRLASIGSEGMAWVLSLGDMMLSPTEPMDLTRRRTIEGDFEMVANMVRPGRVHDFRDPIVGDMLKVVTAFPPARGLTRNLDYVDFTALRSVHGLVLQPKSENLDVAIAAPDVVISSPSGLTVSATDALRNVGTEAQQAARAGFIDLGRFEEHDPAAFMSHIDELEAKAAAAEGRERDLARLDLAQYYLGNHMGYEALGVLDVLESQLKATDLTGRVRMVRAIASIMADRPKDALQTLDAGVVNQELDALFWRTIARVQNHDYKGARLDAIDARTIADTYPTWARNQFNLAAARRPWRPTIRPWATACSRTWTWQRWSPTTSRSTTCSRAGWTRPPAATRRPSTPMAR